MRHYLLIFGLCISVFGASAIALGSDLKTVTLDVDKMTCGMCPITVKAALRKVTGVTEVAAKYEGDGIGWAKVTYDPGQVTVEEITHATEMAGYPSRVKQ